MTWLRLVGTALLLLPVAIHRRRAVRTRPWLLLAYGVFPMAGVQAFYFAAISRVPVGVGLALALGAAACQAGYFLLSDAAGRDADPLAAISHGAIIATALITLLARPWTLPWELLTGTVRIAGADTSAMVSWSWCPRPWPASWASRRCGACHPWSPEPSPTWRW